jgi:hypothetical protein
VAAAMLLACGESPTRERGGELTAEWVGTDSGGISVKPTVIMCEREGRLTITAIKGDLGLGLVLYPANGLTRGKMPIVDPAVDTSTPRAVMAARWIKEKAVVGYQSDTGLLILNSTVNGLGGTFSARLRGLNATDTISLTGHYGRLNPEPCPADRDTAAARPTR